MLRALFLIAISTAFHVVITVLSEDNVTELFSRSLATHSGGVNRKPRGIHKKMLKDGPYETHSTPEKFTWRDLTQEELKSWYTPTDLCTLESTHYKQFPQSIRSKNCSHLSSGSKRMHCGVGMGSSNNPCFGPYSTARPSFKRGINGYIDANSKPLTQLFRNALKTNTTVVLVGDSTMRQKVQVSHGYSRD